MLKTDSVVFNDKYTRTILPVKEFQYLFWNLHHCNNERQNKSYVSFRMWLKKKKKNYIVPTATIAATITTVQFQRIAE